MFQKVFVVLAWQQGHLPWGHGSEFRCLAGATELLKGSGELALNFKDGKRDAFSAIEKKVQKAIEKNYREWIKVDGDAKSDRNLSINAALAQLDLAILLAKPTLKDMVDNRLNGESFVTALYERLPEANLFKQDKIAKQVFKKMLIGVHGLVRGDKDLKPVFDNLVFEEFFVVFDEAQKDRDRKHEEILEKHQQQIDAIHSKMGIPVEKLTALFVAAEHEFPDGNYLEAVERAIDNLITKGGKPVELLNSGDAIVGVIEAARALMRKADAEGAVRLLREERLANMRGNARLAKEEADVLAMTYQWDDAILAWRDAAMLDPDDAWAWYYIGDTHKNRADLGEALKFYRRGEEIAEKTGNSRDLPGGYDRIGDVLIAKGNIEGALVVFNGSLAIRQRLSESDKTNAEWQRDLSVGHVKIGEVLIAKGDVEGALVAFNDSLDIFQRLSESDKTNAGWQRDLSVSHNKIGEVLIAKGDVEGALVTFNKDLAITQRLSDSDKTNTGWQRDLSVCHLKVGEVLIAKGDVEGALVAFKDSLAIHQRLSDSDKTNTGWQRDLSVSHNNIGDVLIAKCDVEGALVAFKDSLAIHQRLSDSDKTNAGWQRDLSVSHDRIGDVLIVKGDVEGALVAFNDSLAIRQRLSDSDKTNAEWQRDLSVSHNKIGDVLIAKGDVEGALVAFNESLTIRQRLSDSDKSNAGWQRDLIVSNVKLAGMGDQSVMRYRAALKIVLELRDSGRLQPVDAWMVAELEELLAQAEG